MSGYSSFIVKIWSEPGRALMRGQIQHVGTEESARFVQMDKMLQFILDHIDDGVHEEISKPTDSPVVTNDE